MTVLKLTKQFNFEMAHALEGYDGLCKNIHGHTYELFVTVIGSPISDSSSPKYGMLIDFKDLKSLIKERIINQFDHALVLSNKTSPTLLKELKLQYERIVITEYQPTSENLLIDFVDRIKYGLPNGVKLFSMKFRETVTSYVEWFADDN
jgi:6-pyruvoyltetrahydropterin/6-carboxytetrahydropterin synthase